MDGTLLNEQGIITEKTAEVIRAFQAKGGIFAINSGRGYQTASKLIKNAGLECDYVCLSGAGIYDKDGNCLMCDCMTEDEVRIVRNIEKKYGLYVNYLTDEGAFCEKSKENARNHYVMEAKILASDSGKEFVEEEAILRYHCHILYNLKSPDIF